MPPIIIANSALVTVEGRYDNQQIVNVFCYRKPAGGVTNGDIDTLGVWWGNNGWPALQQVMSQRYSLYLIKAKNVSVANGYERDIAPTGTQVGIRGGDPLPGQNSICLSWRTPLGGRSNRGRSFIGPVTEGDVTTNYFNTPFMTVVATWGTYMITQRPGGIWYFSVGSRLHGYSTQVTAAAIDTIVDSTDRRKPTRGR